MLVLIVKTRNGVANARVIFDTKQSGVKTITSQAQRVTLPRLFDAILQILRLLTFVASGINGAWEMVEAFVLDFSDAYWEIPIHKAEQQFFRATGLIDGKRKWFVFSPGRSRQLGRRHPLEPFGCLAYAAHPIALRPRRALSSLLRRRSLGSDPWHSG